jgi:DNA-binding transcriptional ArsR family regulator
MRMPASAAKPEVLDRVFSALADPTRRALLERLRRGEATVGDLAAPMAMSLPAVSKHLRTLEDAGLLARRVEGRTHTLSFQPEPLTGAMTWIERQRRFWESSLDRLAETLEADEVAAVSGGKHKRPKS